MLGVVPRRRLLFLGGAFLIGAAVLVLAVAPRNPPGVWVAGAPKENRFAWEKEQAWRNERFVPIADSDDFDEVVRGIPTRTLIGVDPRELTRLRRVLADQLRCRATGDLERYRRIFANRRSGPLDDDQRGRIERSRARVFGKTLLNEWDTEAVFQQFWEREYGVHRFRALAGGDGGSLLVVGEVRHADGVPPEFFFTPEELKHWNRWPGGLMSSTFVFHPGGRSIETVLAERGKVVYAQVLMLIESINDEVWCWETYWFLDPGSGDWQIHGGIAVTRRGPYLCPI